jgi:hypothetical protein
MAALSDYLESGLLSHIFRNTAFSRPSTIAIALTSGVPLDSDSGSTIPELPSGVARGNNFVSTNYKRINLFNPATSGDAIWNTVGQDDLTTYSVYGTLSSGVGTGTYGVFYPLYLNQQTARNADATNTGSVQGFSFSYRFKEFPNVLFHAPESLKQSGLPPIINIIGGVITNTPGLVDPGYTKYEGNGFIKNALQLVFDTAFTDWGWVSGIAIVDTATHGSGNMLMYAKLENPRYVYTGDNIKFDTNSLEISLK